MWPFLACTLVICIVVYVAAAFTVGQIVRRLESDSADKAGIDNLDDDGNA